VITVIGQVATLREEIAWFDRRPLFGRRIVVTRASAQAGSLTARLTSAGADVLEMPATRIEPADDAALRRIVDRLGDYAWLVLTSQNAVSILWRALLNAGRDARALAGLRVACVGPATADALLDRGIAVDVTPERFVAESLLEALAARTDVRGARVLYAAAEGARDVLPRGLEAMGATVDRATLYRSVADGADAGPLREKLLADGADLVTFTSASSVRAFIDAVGVDAARRAPVASIGPITSDAVREAGLAVAIEAAASTIEGLVDAIMDHYAAAASAT
jgi:uroporphyrinogen III methyltransferase/synthase